MMPTVRRLLFVLGILGLASPDWADADTINSRVIRAEKGGATTDAFAITGLPKAMRDSQSDWKPNDPRWTEWLSVYVGEVPNGKQPAVLGHYRWVGDELHFQPRFGWTAGLAYRANIQTAGEDARIISFSIPKPPKTAAAKVMGVYPSGDKIPENVLRFYLHFSQPMAQGDSYEFLHLYNAQGEKVETPFLELPQELWDRDGKRLTLLLDPGRVKQGLKPREEAGPVLVAGEKYALVIDDHWKDANGQPLHKSFRKSFTTTKADSTQPDPKRWQVHTPKSGTRDALVLKFRAPLDHGMLLTAIEVQDNTKTPIRGKITIDKHETGWKFHPDSSWQPGSYSLVVRRNLEDPCGNSIGRPFEVQLDRQPMTTNRTTDVLRFEVRK